MANSYFRFRQFTINQAGSAFKVGTDGVLLGAWAACEGKKKILDIGTGTGLIALMLAQRCEASITAIEPDRNSFLQASENVIQSKWKERIRLENCSLELFKTSEKYDLIVSNPPFFINSLKNPDPLKSYVRHNDNLTHTDILKGAGRLLDESGELQLILPYAEGTIFISLARDHGFYCNRILKVRPLPGSEIKRLLLDFSLVRRPLSEQFLTIESGRRYEFTEDYINLTKDFYIKF